MRKLTVAALVLAGALLVAAPAFAAEGDVIPHGGYNMGTDACLQCHDIHEAKGDYVLMRESTVTQVCATCHTLFQKAPTGAWDPGFLDPVTGAPLAIAGTVPELAAYKVDFPTVSTYVGHRLGLGNNIIPGGSQGLTAIQYLAYDATVPSTTFEATNGLYCASCHTPHGTFGNMMPASFSAALLSSKPNHGEEITGLTDFVSDGGQWCASCHDKRAPDPANELYNHPDTACLHCHGDSAVNPTDDFPHTGSDKKLLTINPDLLCIDACHPAGTLP